MFVLRGVVYGQNQAQIVELLDTDKDKALSTEELEAAEARLKSRDANGNDLIERGELGGAGRVQQKSTFRGKYNPSVTTTALLIGSWTSMEGLHAGPRTIFTQDRSPRQDRADLAVRAWRTDHY